MTGNTCEAAVEATSISLAAAAAAEGMPATSEEFRA